MRNPSAFSLVEVLVVVFIIGLGASLVLPRLVRRPPDKEWPAVTAELNNMLYFARQEAITSQKVHRLTFDEKKNEVRVERLIGSTGGNDQYEPAHSFYFTSRYELPEGVRFVSLKLGKKNLFEQNKGQGWCYVIPHGLVQDVQLVLERSDEDKISKQTLNVAPFLGSFETGEAA